MVTLGNGSGTEFKASPLIDQYQSLPLPLTLTLGVFIALARSEADQGRIQEVQVQSPLEIDSNYFAVLPLLTTLQTLYNMRKLDSPTTSCGLEGW